MRHALGDLFQRVVADKGTAFRFFRDAFLVVLPSASAAEAKELAEQIRDQLAKQPLEAKSHLVYVTMTMGVASYPASGQDAEALVRAAEEAVLQGKESGRLGTITTA